MFAMDNLAVYDILSTRAQFEEILAQNSRSAFRSTGPPPERRSTISTMQCRYQNNNRMRNLSGGSSGSTASGSSSGSSTQLDNQFDKQMTLPLDISLFSNNSNAALPPSCENSSPHRKLDRSWSDDSERNGMQKSINSSRYKTELCRPFEESGSCKYGDKCQFAHGYHELRNLARHPKYKTERCRTFHTVGFCPYGPRCHFIHEDETKPAESSPNLNRSGSIHSSSGSSSPSLSPSGSEDFNMFFYQPDIKSQASNTTNNVNNHFNGFAADINFSGSNCDLYALERQLSNIKLNYDNSIFNNQKPKHGGSEEHDIFSEITMFNSEETVHDNSTSSLSSCAAQSMKLDNFSFVDNRSSTHWQSSSFSDY